MSCGKPCNCPSYRDHCLSVSVSASAMPTRKTEVARTEQLEERWDKDMPAYKRLRKEGLKPKRIDGSAHMEAVATDPLEVQTGHLYGDKLGVVKEIHTALNEGRS